jgi:hypothetical protein
MNHRENYYKHKYEVTEDFSDIREAEKLEKRVTFLLLFVEDNHSSVFHRGLLKVKLPSKFDYKKKGVMRSNSRTKYQQSHTSLNNRM